MPKRPRKKNASACADPTRYVLVNIILVRFSTLCPFEHHEPRLHFFISSMHLRFMRSLLAAMHFVAKRTLRNAMPTRICNTQFTLRLSSESTRMRNFSSPQHRHLQRRPSHHCIAPNPDPPLPSSRKPHNGLRGWKSPCGRRYS